MAALPRLTLGCACYCLLCTADLGLCVLLPACCAQGGQLTPIDLIVEEHFHRAAPGGMGGTKASGNYSPVRALLHGPDGGVGERGKGQAATHLRPLSFPPPACQ